MLQISISSPIGHEMHVVKCILMFVDTACRCCLACRWGLMLRIMLLCYRECGRLCEGFSVSSIQRWLGRDRDSRLSSRAKTRDSMKICGSVTHSQWDAHSLEHGDPGITSEHNPLLSSTDRNAVTVSSFMINSVKEDIGTVFDGLRIQFNEKWLKGSEQIDPANEWENVKGNTGRGRQEVAS